MDTFLVNLQDPSGERYMKLTLRLTISPESAAAKADGDALLMARMRDRILTVLTSKTYAELGNPLGKENLRHEIRAQINPLVQPGQVKDVLFSEFVVQ
jgi:flagellar FliL protein